MASGAVVRGGAGGEGWAAAGGSVADAKAKVAGGECREFVGGWSGEDSGGDCAGEVAVHSRVGPGCLVAGVWAEWDWR